MKIELGHQRVFSPEVFIDAHAHFHRFIEPQEATCAFVEGQFASVSLGVPLSFRDKETGEFFPGLDLQTEASIENTRVHKNMLYAVGIDTVDIAKDEDWLSKSILIVEQHRNQPGNVGIKIWKRLGLSVSDCSGQLVRISHRSFTGFMRYLVAHRIPLYWHYGDPEWLWRPIDDEGLLLMKAHHDWCCRHPEDHMHGRFPAFDQLMDELETLLHDRELRAIKLCGAHLFNLGTDLHRLGRILRRLPGCVVDLGARVVEWMYLVHSGQGAELLSFIREFQDRILYGSDFFLNRGVSLRDLEERYLRRLELETRFLLTTEVVEHPKFRAPVRGLGLSEAIAIKIFGLNAKKWLCL